MNITKEALKQMIAEEMSRLKENNPFERPAGTFAPEKSPEEKAASECRSLRQRVRMAINSSTMPLRVRIDRKLKDQMMASPSCFEKSEFERLVGKAPEGALDELPAELQEGLKKMIAEEMANAGVVNEEDKCAKIRAKEEELFLISKDLEVKGYGFESYQTLQNARELRQANKECFPEYFKDKAPEPGESGYDVTKKQYGLEESKKDALKRIVAEELAKMEIEQLGEEGSLEEIFGLFGDGKLKMVEKEFIPKFRKGLAKLRRHHENVPGHYWHYVTAEAVRRAYNGYQASGSPYREATRKSEEWKELGEEIDALVSNAYNLVKTNAMKDKNADAEDRKKMLSLDAYEADSGFKGTAKSYIP